MNSLNRASKAVRHATSDRDVAQSINARRFAKRRLARAERAANRAERRHERLMNLSRPQPQR
jgi:hypothetical protein